MFFFNEHVPYLVKKHPWVLWPFPRGRPRVLCKFSLSALGHCLDSHVDRWIRYECSFIWRLMSVKCDVVCTPGFLKTYHRRFWFQPRMLVVFLLDTSASMNQRCSNGLSLLDCAKSAVEHFHKVCDSEFLRMLVRNHRDSPGLFTVFGVIGDYVT